MATIILPDLDEQTVDQARAAAVARGGTLEQELRLLIEERAAAADPDRRRRAWEAMMDMKEQAERMKLKYGTFPDTTEMIRQDRHTW